MLKRLELLFFSLILISNSFSEVKDSTIAKSPQNIQNGSKALQFLIGPNVQIINFQGSTLSLKYHLSPKQSIRCGISLIGKSEEYDADNKILENDSLNSKDFTDNDYYSVEINTQYLLYHPNKYSYLFYGVGPLFRYSFSDRYDEIQNKLTGTWDVYETREQKSINYYIGLSFVFGYELFITKTISLHGEYNQEVTYHHQHSKDVRPYKVIESSSSGFLFRGNSIKFGCSFYW
ncbi:MAG TPA: hypothetical protein P5268_07975 [Candidatus Marinimicrobia bacterium]|nr:hypothetical protein [Candidatus Neomarinimicrobiota bacterium]HRS52770.1 hypothetical protein [Candidatus Neomarinimicrobiota bacterium]HRU92951.1 hypothetical protein [Candidatus Neomarinimicrobiota bacterium]